MDRLARYKTRRAALLVGRELDQAWPHGELTGISFLVEPEGTVIIAAEFNKRGRKPRPVKISVVLFPGEDLNITLEELLAHCPPGKYSGIFYGLEDYEKHCSSWGVKI